MRSVITVCFLGLAFAAYSATASQQESKADSGATQKPRDDLKQRASDEHEHGSLMLLVKEANCFATKLGLPEKLPITETDLVQVLICPPRIAKRLGAIGLIKTQNYSYSVARDNKLCYLVDARREAHVARWKANYSWPLTRLDTDAAYHLATQWLAAASVDVSRLDRDSRARVEACAPQGLRKGAHFTPLYMVYWAKGAEGTGSTASVELFLPTRALVQLRVEDPRYILRRLLENPGTDRQSTESAPREQSSGDEPP